jgi:Voltage-dependent anion channel
MRWHSGDTLRPAARGVRAGSLTVIMATGITSAAMRLVGLPQLADVLLAIAAAGFVLLAVLLTAGCWRNPARAVDRSSPGAAFAAFAFTAACAVLGRGLVATGLTGPGPVPPVLVLAALVLAVLGGASWLALTVLVPVRMAIWPGERPVLADVAGTWYLWAVATQSLAITAVFLHAMQLGQAAGRPWMHGTGTALAWVAVTVWAAVFAAMAAAPVTAAPVTTVPVTTVPLASKDSRARGAEGQRGSGAGGSGAGGHDDAAHARSLRKYQALLTLLQPADGGPLARPTRKEPPSGRRPA